jgi:hypothetical protein
MVKLFSEPHTEVLSGSSGTVYLCNPCKRVVAISIASICLVVAMFPDMCIDQLGDISLTGNFSLMQHPYLEVAKFTNNNSFEDDEDNED